MEDHPKKTKKSKLTDETRTILVESARIGLTKALACARAGISKTVLFYWLEQGEKDRQEGKIPWPIDPDTKRWLPRTNMKFSKHLDLLNSMEKAESERLAEALMLIRQAARGGAVVERTTTTTTGADGTPQTRVREKVAEPDWKASAWLAERTRRQDYGVTRQEVTGADGGPVQVTTFAELVRKAADEEAKEEAEKKKEAK
jgi:hypothetical protein